jgi:phosphoribosylanthranilate isomerase
MTRIKVCGNTNLEDVTLALELGVDLLGFIFTRSKRQITIDQGRTLTASIPAQVERVGVFIDEPTSRIAEVIEACALNAVQLYRPITEADRRLGIPLLAAVRIGEGRDTLDNGHRSPDRLLLDTYRPDTDGGGTGQPWNWELATSFGRGQPIIVSGGLRPDNVSQAIRRLRPWGVDVCSGVETEPGKKDPGKLRAFVAAVRAADQP